MRLEPSLARVLHQQPIEFLVCDPTSFTLRWSVPAVGIAA
jgi:hypothetical protein